MFPQGLFLHTLLNVGVGNVLPSTLIAVCCDCATDEARQ